MTASPLVTDHLVKRFGRRRALDGFTLNVPANSVLGLLGRNGSGKTTWMSSVAGFLSPDSGSISLFGDGPFDPAVHAGRLGVLPQDAEMPRESRPRESLVAWGVMQGMGRAKACAEAESLLKAFNLSDRADAPFPTLSHGMRKRAAIAQAFIGAPELVLLDEPFGGLDPEETLRLREFILARRGRCSFVGASHDLHDLECIATHFAFVANGRVAGIVAASELGGRSLEDLYIEKIAGAKRPEE